MKIRNEDKGKKIWRKKYIIIKKEGKKAKIKFHKLPKNSKLQQE